MKVFVLAGLAESLLNFRGRLLEALAQTGLEVHVGAPELGCSRGITKQLAGLGYVTHSVAMARTGLNPFLDLFSLVSLFLKFVYLRPRHVLAYTAKPVIYGIIAAKLAGVQGRTALITGLGFSFENHTSALKKTVQFLVTHLYRVALSCATQVVFQNPDDRNLFVEMGLVAGDKTSLVNGSGVPLDVFKECALPEMQEVHFLLVARLIRSKGIYEYVDAAKMVQSKYVNAKFHLVGFIDSNPSAISEADLSTWVADGTVVFHGELSDVRDVLAKCHVYVLPSYREGTPRSVLEAMATGRAIITTDVPGCRETVEEGINGYLVPPQNSAAIANACVNFLENPALIMSMGRKSRELAEQKYDVDKVNLAMLTCMGVQ
jgi:glycosyltransferase involved in cell wall biosynthesis